MFRPKIPTMPDAHRPRHPARRRRADHRHRAARPRRRPRRPRPRPGPPSSSPPAPRSPSSAAARPWSWSSAPSWSRCSSRSPSPAHPSPSAPSSSARCSPPSASTADRPPGGLNRQVSAAREPCSCPIHRPEGTPSMTDRTHRVPHLPELRRLRRRHPRRPRPHGHLRPSPPLPGLPRPGTVPLAPGGRPCLTAARPDHPRRPAEGGLGPTRPLADQIRRTGGCSDPIHLTGWTLTKDKTTGETLHHYSTASEPGGRLRLACGNRRASRCPSCAWTYAGDTYHLIRAGLAGDDRRDIPATVRDHPRVFATLTAPSFGPVHNRPDRGTCRCGTQPPRRRSGARHRPRSRDVRLRRRRPVQQPRRRPLAALHHPPPPRDSPPAPASPNAT